MMQKEQNNYEIVTTSILKITVIALLSSFTFTLNIIFRFIPGFEFITFMLVVSFVVFKLDVGFAIINVCCALQMIINGVVIEITGLFIIMNLYGLITFFLRRIINRFWWIIIILMPFYSVGVSFTNFLQWIIMYDIKTASALFISHRIPNEINFGLNFFFPILLFPAFWRILIMYREKWPFMFNQQFINNSKVNLYKIKKQKKGSEINRD